MSARQIKKLQKREKKEEGKDHSDESSDEEIRSPPRNPFAAFASLGQEGEEADNEHSLKEEEQEEESGEKKGEKEEDEVSQAQSQPPKSSKNKKKTKKKPKNSEQVTTDGNQKNSSTAAARATTSVARDAKRGGSKGGKADDLDEIDRALQELNTKAQSQQQQIQQQREGTLFGRVPTVVSHLVKVNFHNLKVLNELREVFGRDTIQAAQTGNDNAGRPAGERVEGRPGVVMVDLETYLSADAGPPGNMARRGAASNGIVAMAARRNPFIQWKNNWPLATTGGLSMQQLSDKSIPAGVTEFTFVHSTEYQHLETAFFQIVRMHNPNALISFLKGHPYHISSLIQVSRVAKQDQNAVLAADLCERALFSFGRATLSSFRQKLEDGQARLSFRRPENRQFLLAGYYYIRSLIPRGTYRTALAWVKVFLSAISEDGYGLMLYAHVLAIRAFEAQWLLELCTPGGGDGNGDDRIFTALRENPMCSYIEQTLVLARLQTKDVEGARAALAAGMAKLPWLYAALLQALNMDVPRAIWAIQARDTTGELYTKLYVHLSRDIWSATPQATGLLREVAQLMARPDIAALPADKPITWNVARFVYLEGAPELMALVPSEMLHSSPNYDFDPLPPKFEENILSDTSQYLPWGDSEMHGLFTSDDNEVDDGEAGQPLYGNEWPPEVALAMAMAMAGSEEDRIMDELDLEGEVFSETEERMVGSEEEREIDRRLDELLLSPDEDGDSDSDDAAPRRTHGVPGAWVEDVEDEEFAH